MIPSARPCVRHNTHARNDLNIYRYSPRVASRGLGPVGTECTGYRSLGGCEVRSLSLSSCFFYFLRPFLSSLFFLDPFQRIFLLLSILNPLTRPAFFSTALWKIPPAVCLTLPHTSPQPQIFKESLPYFTAYYKAYFLLSCSLPGRHLLFLTLTAPDSPYRHACIFHILFFLWIRSDPQAC